jgi:hypothetical protein
MRDAKNRVALKQMFGTLIVWHCEHRLDHDQIEYTAECDDFSAIEDGHIPPEYQAMLQTIDGVPYFTGWKSL